MSLMKVYKMSDAILKAKCVNMKESLILDYIISYL